MAIISRADEATGYAPNSFAFWRNQVIYFCAFSVIGHWMEIAYCSFMNIFGIVDADSLVWDDPMYPFIVYGVGVLVCALALVPLRIQLVEHMPSVWGAAILFFLITVGVCMVMELGMGLMLNQPDEFGTYPLWDNSQLPGNIFGQAWIVNDVGLGAVAMLYTWVIYPLCQKALLHIPNRIMNVVAFAVVVGFVALCICKF